MAPLAPKSNARRCDDPAGATRKVRPGLLITDATRKLHRSHARLRPRFFMAKQVGFVAGTRRFDVKNYSDLQRCKLKAKIRTKENQVSKMAMRLFEWNYKPTSHVSNHIESYQISCLKVSWAEASTCFEPGHLGSQTLQRLHVLEGQSQSGTANQAQVIKSRFDLGPR